jgi:hypothetical protein
MGCLAVDEQNHQAAQESLAISFEGKSNKSQKEQESLAD